ncbi:hypothetical protein ACQUSY_13315 [Microbacterium sp. YY-03]|uniref:hypothetical protein n=1 Tax=Microbacterium sp. YY-03 TaxID=3421636 RepID=UPI003D180E59
MAVQLTKDEARRLAVRAQGPLAAPGIPDTAAVAHRSESGWYGPNQVPRMLEVLQRAGEARRLARCRGARAGVTGGRVP